MARVGSASALPLVKKSAYPGGDVVAGDVYFVGAFGSINSAV